jgi:hypothetical protein
MDKRRLVDHRIVRAGGVACIGAFLVAACTAGPGRPSRATSFPPTLGPAASPAPAAPTQAHAKFEGMAWPSSTAMAAVSLTGDRFLFVGFAPIDGATPAAVFCDSESGCSETDAPASLSDAPTLTALADGRALLIDEGGDEIYDPATRAWTATGPMLNPRSGATATLLDDGRVLVAGGSKGDLVHFFSAAEVYDPSTGKFTATGSLLDARESAQAVRLADGRVLVIGGRQGYFDEGGQLLLSRSGTYDPRTGRFTATGSMRYARVDFSATLLPDGRVLVAGGDGHLGAGASDPAKVNTEGLATAEIYDPTTGAFSPTGSMGAWRAWHAAVLLEDGRVLVAGGRENPDTLAELYDPKTGQFSPAASMVEYRGRTVAVRLPDGTVLLCDGSNPTAELYTL